MGGQILQGASVALSPGGNTLLVGGTGDNGTGAVWVFNRSGNLWTQHGSKLTGSGGVAPENFGSSLAISADSAKFAAGGMMDHGGLGAVWVVTLAGSDWVQQGTKLVGNESVDTSAQGFSVGISADGNTAVADSPGANGSVGKVWVFNRSLGTWTKQSAPLVGTGADGADRQGWSVAISSEGTFIESGPYDNGTAGAFWSFRSPNIGIAQIPGLPADALLGQNYPNPFSLSTKIRFRTLNSACTKVTVYDLAGREVATLVNGQLPPGSHDVEFDAGNLAGGSYFCKLETDGAMEIRKMMLVK